MSESKEVQKKWAHLSSTKRELLERRLRGLKGNGRPVFSARAGMEGAPIPLSFAQQRLWFLDQLEPGNAIYNVPAAVRLRGNLDVEALERTLSEIIRRHETLRTTFAKVNGVPVQVVGPSQPFELQVQDLSRWPTDERESRALEVAQSEARQPFDLSLGPLLRVVLLRLDEEEFVALLTMHHIISDGLSMTVLVREIAAIYGAFSAGLATPLAELPSQYADFAVWQREYLQGELLERELRFWREQLGGKLPLLELPSDRPRVAGRSRQGATVSLDLPTALTENMRGLCRREGVTLFMALLAAYKILLHCYSGQEDIIVGSPISNRKRAQFENLIGFFIDTLVLRTNLSGDPSFRELLGRVRDAALNAYSHASVPFEKLVEELQPERSRSHTPIFQVWMNVENTSEMELELPGLSFSAFPLEKQWAKFDLALLIHEQAEKIDCVFEYDADLFDAKTIKGYAGAFQTILDQFVAQPDMKLSALKEMLTEQERQGRLLEEQEYENSVQQKLKGLRRRVAR